MLSDEEVVKNSDLVNSLNTRGFTLGNRGIEINREVLLSNYTEEATAKAWGVLCQFIIKNYNLGKGTYIKGFGTFTFDNYKVNLEGTTNQYVRDQKLRSPVFIVSPEFNENLKPGQYTKNGVIYYTQKQNNSVNHVKANYAEMSYAISMSKDECSNIINHLIKHISDSIRNGSFKNKELPGVGVLMLNRNVIGVKFNEDLIRKSRVKPQKLLFTKRSVQLGMDMSQSMNTAAFEVMNPYKNIEELRPATSVLTKIEKSGEQYMKSNFDIDVNAIPTHEIKKIYRPFSQSQSNYPIKFINDKLKKKKVYVNGMKLKDMNLDNDILSSFEFFKGSLISNMKKYDLMLNGHISIQDCISAMLQSNIHPKMDKTLAKSIVDIYSMKLDNIDYMKFIACLIKDARMILEPVTKENRSNSINKIFNPTLNKFELTSMKSPNSSRNNIMRINPNTLLLSQKRKEVDSVRKELNVLNALLPELKYQYRTTLEQNISYIEFMNILSKYSVVYPKEKIFAVLNFLEIKNLNAFNLIEFENNLKKCKILSTSMDTADIIKTFNKLKDIIFINGGKQFLFKNGNSLSCDDFISLLQPKSNFDTDTLTSVFNYLVKTDRPFTMEDYKIYIENAKTEYDSNFESTAMKAISALVEKKHLKTDEYFDHLLTYNVSTKNKVLSRPDFISIMQKEHYNYSAEDIDYIFSYIDYKKDNVIDREEFVSKVSYESLPLTVIQDVIKKNNLDIEDLAHRMNINKAINEKLTFDEFKSKIKMLDYTLSNEFILSMFTSLKNKNENCVETKKLIEELNVFKKEHARNPNIVYHESFTQHYMDVVKSRIGFMQIKKMFEDNDQNSTGVITKSEYMLVMEKVLPDFSDEDNMKFVRVTNMFNKNMNVKYPELLNLIYYNEKSDNFTHLLELMKNTLTDKLDRSIDKMFKYLNNAQKVFPVSLKRMSQFILNELGDKTITNKTICKLDLDADGLISYDDFRGVIGRYVNTSFFKYENAECFPDINLYPSETMKEDKFKSIVKKLKHYMKMKNITEIGLFHKLDKNNDGFISNIDFNATIDSILQLAPAVKAQFFNFLDFYHNGLVDLETFIYRFKEFHSSSVIAKNNNMIENVIINEFANFIKNNLHLSETEIFALIDKDCDGIINIKDFKYFIINSLSISSFEFNDYKIERVMQVLSLTKNKQISLIDIKEFIDKSKSGGLNKYHINLKEIFKVTTNQNLAPNKENTEWISEIIERFGMFISEKYESIKEFFEENTEKGSNKFRYEDFIKFHENNYECFNNGFNLTKDELLAIFTSLDSQKKNYLLLQDLENKLMIFDYYQKMHIDVKKFITQNFYNGVDAFKFFIKNTNAIPNTLSISDLNKISITKKEFFDAFDYFFPNKYSTNTILKYFNKYFKSQNKISFSEFNYVYFDKMQSDESFLHSKLNETKLLTSRNELSKSQCNFYPKNKTIRTPFDIDPLNKIKRIVQSSKFDLNKFFMIAKAQSLDGIVNKFQFRNMIKHLDIGLTNLEIDQIMSKCGMTYDGKLNINDFIKFLRSEDSIIGEGKKNVAQVIGDIKHLMYKYYSNPILCFQFNDKNVSLKLDFEKFKQIVMEMYRRDQIQAPNFTMLKNAYDTIDLRKDGIVDMNEWMRSFGSFNGSLDYGANKIENGFDFFNKKKMNRTTDNFFTNVNRKVLREWETSSDICDIYKLISRNKKIIKESLKQYSLNDNGDMLVQSDNLISVLKDVLPKMKLSHTQWKMLVLIGKTEIDNLIDLGMFFRMIEVSAKNLKSNPRKMFK